MPKLVKELHQGKAFGRSSDGGTLADTATRVWKIVLNTPGESFDISSEIGVQIGDPLDGVNPIPCYSIDVKGDGESRMVRIVTAQYRSSPLVDGGPGLPDPMLVMPDVRPANFSTSTSLYEMPAVRAFFSKTGGDASRNPLGDPFEGLTKLEPITTIRVTQFEQYAGTRHLNLVGKINSEEMTLGSYATFPPHTVMFRGVEANPHVETFGIVTYRGFMNSYEFAYRRNYVTDVYDGSALVDAAVGWDAAVVVEGYSCRAFIPLLGTEDDDIFGIPLAIDPNTETIKNPPQLAEGASDGDRVRGMIKIVNPQTGKIMQNPSAMPIALNNDGLPRKINMDPRKGPIKKPILWWVRLQDEADLVTTLNLRVG